jgi:DNA-binding LacI/PurR family transcriptional regulator
MVNMKKNVTIHDVANLAQVSVATVSAVINKNKYVSPELLRRVETAIEKLNYRPNMVARSLKKSETKTIGLIFSNITSPVVTPLVTTSQAVAQEAGFDTFLVATGENVEREKVSVNNLLSKRVDGLLISPAVSEDYSHLTSASRSVPLVVIQRQVSEIECVITNNEEISYQAVSHLADHGYKKIGVVTIPIAQSKPRIDGYRRALTERGLFDESLIRQTDFVGNTAYDYALDLISKVQVDAVFTTSQSTTLGVIRAARHLRRHIPDDLALFGYDDVPWMEIVSPPISTTHQPIRKMAQLATELLLLQLDGQTSTQPIHTLESDLIIRQSCGCPPGGTDGSN